MVGTPASFASFETLRVPAGGVMMETECAKAMEGLKVMLR
jgi:hypothetical protein